VFVKDRGSPELPFTLVFTRKGNDITVVVNNREELKYHDPEPLTGKHPMQIGGYLSRLYLGEAHIESLAGPPLVAKVDPKNPKDGKKGPPEPGNRTVLQLGDQAKAVEIAGDGRYLLAHLPKQRKLVQIDPAKAEIIRDLPLDGDNFYFTAGRDKLVIYWPFTRRLERYNLETLKREIEEPFPFKGDPKAMCMGSASQGPILVAGEGQFPWNGGGLIALDTLKPIDIPSKVEFNFHEYRAAPTGKVFTMWRHNGQGRGALTLTDKGVVFFGDGERASVTPTYDGKYLATSGINQPGARTSGVILTPEFKVATGGVAGPDRHLFTPYTGPYYYNLKFGPSRSKLDFYRVQDMTPFATLLDVQFGDREYEDEARDKRIIVLPQARQVITRPISWCSTPSTWNRNTRRCLQNDAGYSACMFSFSFASASLSIWRTRSRVRPRLSPISLRVFGSWPSIRPKRMRRTVASRGSILSSSSRTCLRSSDSTISRSGDLELPSITISSSDQPASG
jgi:hypothetical protein